MEKKNFIVSGQHSSMMDAQTVCDQSFQGPAGSKPSPFEAPIGLLRQCADGNLSQPRLVSCVNGTQVSIGAELLNSELDGAMLGGVGLLASRSSLSVTRSPSQPQLHRAQHRTRPGALLPGDV